MDLDNTTISIWVGNNPIQVFKLLTMVDKCPLEKLTVIETSYIDFRTEPADGALQLNVPLTLFTKLLILKEQNK